MDIIFWKKLWMVTLFFGFIGFIGMFFWVAFNGYKDLKKLFKK